VPLFPETGTRQGGLPRRVGLETFRDVDFNYDYPKFDETGRELNLKPGEKLHDDIVAVVNHLAMESHHEISKRYPSWEEVDRTLTAFIVQDDKEENLLRKDSRKITSFVLPMSFVVMETILTQLVSAFLSGPTLFRYIGTGPEDEVSAILKTQVIEAQMRRSKVRLALRTFFRDSLAKGISAVAPVWEQEFGPITRTRDTFDLTGITGNDIVM